MCIPYYATIASSRYFGKMFWKIQGCDFKRCTHRMVFKITILMCNKIAHNCLCYFIRYFRWFFTREIYFFKGNDREKYRTQNSRARNYCNSKKVSRIAISKNSQFSRYRYNRSTECIQLRDWLVSYF